MPLCGGLSELKVATAEVQSICNEIRKEVEEKLGHEFDEFLCTGFSSQVVAGVNYFVKMKIGADKFMHLRIYRDLKGKISLHGMQENKQESDLMEYF